MTATFDFSGHAVLVTGRTSGIGLAIARAFRDAGAQVAITGTRAGPGDYDVDLSGLAYQRADMADLEALPGLAASFPRLDVLVNNAGTAVREDPLSETAFERTIDINLNSVYRLSHLFRERLKVGPGSIVNIASMTSYFASPRVPGYGASKAAVRSWGEGLRGRLRPHGIAVNVICPGFVVSRITDANTFRMPLLMEAGRAAEIIMRGLERNKGRIAFPWPMYLTIWILNALPASWSDRLLAKLPDKG